MLKEEATLLAGVEVVVSGGIRADDVGRVVDLVEHAVLAAVEVEVERRLRQVPIYAGGVGGLARVELEDGAEAEEQRIGDAVLNVAIVVGLACGDVSRERAQRAMMAHSGSTPRRRR